MTYEEWEKMVPEEIKLTMVPDQRGTMIREASPGYAVRDRDISNLLEQVPLP